MNLCRGSNSVKGALENKRRTNECKSSRIRIRIIGREGEGMVWVGWRHTIALIAVSFRRENRARSIRAGLDVDYVTHPCPTSTPKPLPPRPPPPRVTQRRKVTSHRDNRAPRRRVGRHGNAISPFSCVCLPSPRQPGVISPSFILPSRYINNLDRDIVLSNYSWQIFNCRPLHQIYYIRFDDTLSPRPDFVSIGVRRQRDLLSDLSRGSD